MTRVDEYWNLAAWASPAGFSSKPAGVAHPTTADFKWFEIDRIELFNSHETRGPMVSNKRGGALPAVVAGNPSRLFREPPIRYDLRGVLERASFSKFARFQKKSSPRRFFGNDFAPIAN